MDVIAGADVVFGVNTHNLVPHLSETDPTRLSGIVFNIFWILLTNFSKVRPPAQIADGIWEGGFV